jgi:glycosyltransferase involved in cell wall biosynthesis
MEYLVLGKAVVAPATPNLQEVLTDNVNALMFEPAKPGALEGTLTRLCTDTSLRQRLAQGAADTIDRLELTWVGNARRVTALVKAGA